MIAPGSRLGSFEIIAPLGAGGMGQVYRARDIRLNRTVAIKLLPASFSEHSVRLQRFEQEARSASSLNHPNIVTIYELGYDAAGPYIAMELVEGKTLRELLNQGPLPIRKVIEMAAQVADGLTKAHEAGITHRDLKPENLMVTHEGLVKILDFGLAKLTSPSGVGADTASSMTTASVTASGTILGTVGYMSPEQVAGKGLDFRSDQFSFGLVLYELVAGKRAFQRATAAETLVAILREQAEPVGVQNREAPAPLCWAIERCMEKAPQKRYASTRELARELAAIGERLLEKPAPPMEIRASNLPVSRTGFVGREKEVAAGKEMLLRPDVRLVTITGPEESEKRVWRLR
jgi:eukaryotic-like serine/threonine-protein kinase